MANQNFHETKKAAAVLKHAVINSYVTPFASKTGSTSVGGRVAFIDGYAGPGRYDDGAEGSGAILLRHAHALAKIPRQLECHFVENDPGTVAKLRAVIAAEGQGVVHTVYDRDIAEELPKALAAASGVPLLAYLDPCGLVIPFEQVVSIFERPGGQAPTEVLINLTAHLRRFAGMLTSDKAVEASLQRVDEVCGGDWWRAAWLEHGEDKTAAEEAVVEGYAARLRARVRGMGTWTIDVRPKAGLKPLYYLIFATRHPAGMVKFGESVSLGLQAWRRARAQDEARGTLLEPSWEEDWKAQEADLKEQWIATLVERLDVELSKGAPFRIVDKADEILRSDLVGSVRGLHLRAAIDRLFKAGKTTTDPKGKSDYLFLVLTPA